MSTDKEKGKEIVTVQFTRQNNFETSTTTREFPRSTAEKGMKSKAGAWKHARIITKPVEVDLRIPKKEVKVETEDEPKKETEPKKMGRPKKEETQE